MSEARSSRDAGVVRLLSEAGQSPYEVIQEPTGRAAVLDSRTSVAAGAYGTYFARDVFTVKKAAGIVLLKGGRAYWDHSANEATYKAGSDRDFYLGRVAEDAPSSATTCLVELNIDPVYDHDLARDAYTTVPVGTQAVGAFGEPRRQGGALLFELSATNEAQKVDALSIGSWPTAANAIIEGAFRIVGSGSSTAVDINVGVASGTHATDADSIAQSIFLHIDGGSTTISAESDDGTNEVAATDTTVDFTEGATLDERVEFWIDMRNPADVALYLNGVQVLDGTTFNVNAGASPWYLLAHLEKTSGTAVAKVAVDWLRCRLSEQ